jgi:AraC family transcriptional regulator
MAAMSTLRFAPTRFPAPVTRARTIGDFILSETRYGSEATLSTHAHEYACLVFAMEGTFEERCGATERTVAPGMLIIRPPGEPHSDRFGRAGGRCLNVELPPPWLSSVRHQTRSDSFTGTPFDLLGRRLCDELRNGDGASPIAVESIVLELLAGGDRAQRRARHAPPQWLVTARDIVHHRMSERFTLSMIASQVGVHPIHLAASFQHFFGQSVGAYLRFLRIGDACRRLKESDEPLADIALAAGFCDQSHFGRTFKRIMRATPRQYRAWSRAS